MVLGPSRSSRINLPHLMILNLSISKTLPNKLTFTGPREARCLQGTVLSLWQVSPLVHPLSFNIQSPR